MLTSYPIKKVIGLSLITTALVGLSSMAIANTVTTTPDLPSQTTQPIPPTKGKILVVMTNHADYPSRPDKTGVWVTELTHFYDVADKAGYQMDFVSPNGGAIPLDERSMKPIYLDKSARDHLADPAFRQRLNTTLAPTAVNPSIYKAIYYTGGHGTLWDFPNSHPLANLAESIYRQGGVVSALCHGVSGLLPLQNNQGKPLISDVPLTGFANSEETLSRTKSQVPFLLQDALVAKGAKYQRAMLPFTSHVIVSDRIITGQNPQSSKEVGEAVVKRLQSIP